MSNSRIALLVGAALAVGVGVVSVSTSAPVISKVFTSVSGLATGDGRRSNPLDVTVHTSGSISGTGAAAAPISAGDQLGFGYALFGDGFDGSATISSNTTMSRDMFYEDLTISSGFNLDTNGWRLFVRGTLTLDGTISRNGNNGTNSGVCQLTISTCINSSGGAARAGNMLPSSCAGGNACVAVTSPFPATAGTGATVGGAGAGATGRSGARGQGGAGGAGGGGSAGNNGSNGSGGGAIGTVAANSGNFHDWRVAISNRYRSSSSVSGLFNSGSGTGGCGGQPGTTTPPPGGGGGGSAGWVAVLAYKIEGSGSINAIGGTGGAGSTCNSATRGGAGGGGGGAGGMVVVLIGTGAYPTTSAAGGAGGAGGGNSVGHAGGAGGSGGPGYVMLFRAGV